MHKVEVRDGQPVMVRQAEIELINDKVEKALSIQRVIGRRPILAFGNSDGDLPMLQWTASGAGRRFCGYVHHTDADREYAYDRTAATGRLDKGLDEAAAKGWTVVDMKRDWKRVFPFEAAPPASDWGVRDPTRPFTLGSPGVRARGASSGVTVSGLRSSARRFPRDQASGRV